jgi:hypothetical protein
VVPLHDEHSFPTVVIAPALHSFGSLLRRSLSIASFGPRTLLVSSGGSQYHGRSIDLDIHTVRSIVVLPRTPQIQQFLLPADPVTTASSAAHPMIDSLVVLHSVSCSLDPCSGIPRTPTYSIEVLRSIVDSH